MPDIQPVINDVSEASVAIGHAEKVVYMAHIPGDPDQWVMTYWDLVAEEKRTVLCRNRAQAFEYAEEDGFRQFTDLSEGSWTVWRSEQGWVDKNEG